MQREHLDEQRLGIALVVYPTLLVFFTTEFCLAENGKALFRTL